MKPDTYSRLTSLLIAFHVVLFLAIPAYISPIGSDFFLNPTILASDLMDVMYGGWRLWFPANPLLRPYHDVVALFLFPYFGILCGMWWVFPGLYLANPIVVNTSALFGYCCMLWCVYRRLGRFLLGTTV
jgi:hypothetical protein